LQDAMQPGKIPPATNNRLNEHGFGLKHSLATLTKKTQHWQIWSKDPETKKVSSVRSPFGHQMKIEDDDKFPTLPYTINNFTTVIQVETTLDYIQSVQGRGKKAEDITKLRFWLMEYIGITYRGFLSQDPNNNYEIDGSIFVSIDTDQLKVFPIEIPMDGSKTNEFTMELGGKNHKLLYVTGLISEVKQLITNKLR
jgi:hypothetical protein